METCVRGFSFMPETNVDVIDLKVSFLLAITGLRMLLKIFFL